MSASVEELCGQLVAGERAYRPKRYFDHRFLGVLAQEAGQHDVLDAKRYVDKAFAIAPDVVELLLLLHGERDQGGAVFGIDFHLRQYMPHQAQTAFGVGVEDLAVDGVFVNAFGQQLADDEVDFTVVGVVGEASRVGHHACVDAFGSFLGDVVEVAHAADKPENQFGSRRDVRVRDDNLAEVLRIEVMVYQYLPGRRGLDGRSHGVDAVDGVEVEAADDVGFGYQPVGKVPVAVVQQDFFASGHPLEEVGKGVGDDDMDRFPLSVQKVPQAQRGADGISVGTDVGYDDYLFGPCHPFGKVVDVRLVYYFT